MCLHLENCSIWMCSRNKINFPEAAEVIHCYKIILALACKRTCGIAHPFCFLFDAIIQPSEDSASYVTSWVSPGNWISSACYPHPNGQHAILTQMGSMLSSPKWAACCRRDFMFLCIEVVINDLTPFKIIPSSMRRASDVKVRFQCIRNSALVLGQPCWIITFKEHTVWRLAQLLLGFS